MIEIKKYGRVIQFNLTNHLTKILGYCATCYLVDGLLIDTGFSKIEKEFIKCINQYQIHSIVNTHHHEDHTGNNAIISQEKKIPIYVHPKAMLYLQNPEIEKYYPYQKIIWGRPIHSSAEAIGRTFETENFRFEVIETPGHTETHICLYEPKEGWFFGGDLFLGIKVAVARASENILQLIKSLRKIAKIDISIYFDGHGKVLENPKIQLQSKIDFLEELKERAQKLYKRGFEIEEIVNEIFGREHFIYYLTSKQFSHYNLICSLLKD